MESPELKMRALSAKEAGAMTRPFELDLEAAYRVMQTDVLNLVAKAEREGWTPEQLIRNVEELVMDGEDEAAEAISSAVGKASILQTMHDGLMAVAKAYAPDLVWKAAYKVGNVVHRKDGWFRKLNDAPAQWERLAHGNAPNPVQDPNVKVFDLQGNQVAGPGAGQAGPAQAAPGAPRAKKPDAKPEPHKKLEPPAGVDPYQFDQMLEAYYRTISAEDRIALRGAFVKIRGLGGNAGWNRMQRANRLKALYERGVLDSPWFRDKYGTPSNQRVPTAIRSAARIKGEKEAKRQAEAAARQKQYDEARKLSAEEKQKAAEEQEKRDAERKQRLVEHLAKPEGKDELAQKIHAQNPHPVLTAGDIKRKLEQKNPDELAQLADQYGIRPPRKNLPAGWQQMTHGERLKADRQNFVEDLLDARANAGNVIRARDEKFFLEMDDEDLKARYKNYVGEDAVHAARAREAAKAEMDKYMTPNPANFQSPVIEGQLAGGSPQGKGTKLGGGHTNAVYRIHLKTNSGKEKVAVFKPVEGEYKDKNVRGPNMQNDRQWLREQASWAVNAAWGLGNHPAVVLRRVDGKPGAVMDWVADAKEWGNAGLSYHDVPKVEWQKLAVFDWVTGNTDRHYGNFMVDQNKKLWAIDNGLAFPEEKGYGNYVGYRSWPHRDLEKHGHLALEDDVKKFFTPEVRAKLEKAIATYDLFPPFVAETMLKRFDYLAKHGSLPKYDSDDFMHAGAGVP